MLNFVIDNNLAFSVIQSPSFAQMIHALVGREVPIPSTTTFMNFLKSSYEAVKKKLTEVLNQQRHLCITADVWSSRAQAYLGMTVHFINQNFERVSFVLAFRQMKCKQTYSVLTHEIAKVLDEFSISVDKVTHIVTDGGSAFCKAFKVFGKSVDHLIERADTEDEVEGESDLIPFIQHEDGEYLYSNIIPFRDQFETDLEYFNLDDSNDNLNVTEGTPNEEINDFFHSENDETENVRDEIETEPDPAKLPPHRRCVSHFANLVPKDFEDQLNGRAKTALVSVLGKLKTIWVLPRRSAFAKTIAKEVLGCTLKLPCETRWNSKFDAIKHFYGLKSRMHQFIDKLKENIKAAEHLPKLTNEDWLTITAYLKVMEPVAVCLDRLQGEQNSSQGFILPAIEKMKYDVTQVDGGNCTKCFKETMLSVINRRFEKYFKMDETNRELIVAAVTIPRFKTDFIQHDYDVEMARRMLKSECLMLSPHEHDEANASASVSNDELFISYSTRRLSRRGSIEHNIDGEIERYLTDDRKDLSILKEYPNICDVYQKFNTTLASSGAIERVFSQSSLIFTPRRNRISEFNFEYAIILKYNRVILDQ